MTAAATGSGRRVPGQDSRGAPVPVPPTLPPVRGVPRLSPERRAILALRVGLGVVWAANLVFIAAPQNQFFPTFGSTASGFAPTSLGGGAFAQFIASQPTAFALLIAATTAYLAVAFLTGFTLRLAVVVGVAFNMALLLTQFGSTFFFPGGTDIGPQPLYLLLYLGLALGDASRYYSIDAWLARHLTATPSAVFRLVGTGARRAPGVG
jgi:hypothetical protein